MTNDSLQPVEVDVDQSRQVLSQTIEQLLQSLLEMGIC